MIFDKIENLHRYTNLLNTTAILNTINNKVFETVENGKFKIESDDFFGIRLQYETKDSQDCLWEAHKKYLDIHVILEGQEIIAINDIANMAVIKKYDRENDYWLFKGLQEQNILLQKGYFLALNPNEVHKTSIKINGINSIQKIVFKQKL